ncbi:hypothetical protein PPTG_03034 [Phytophthora nicotianae INRA-310]|uniref:START domain-containing protein n=1 Tax=Phytophthora nicotianae (strain INRA-310) TaxID=761204 RepID=W2R5X6_PHYN3|nr:hypothetical protein PPTG_03034 [Phytophthora nicotianae INRA-310]ETN19915.1 hypothetical protein PPTG_03034 [Phytophthora nicotianae INRA-310]
MRCKFADAGASEGKSTLSQVLSILWPLYCCNARAQQQTLRSSNKYGIHYYFDADDGDMVVMQRLRGDLEQVYADTDLALVSTGLDGISSPCSLTNLTRITDAASCIDVLLSRIIPFDCKIVGDAFWYEVTKTGVENKVEPGKPPQKEKATVILQSFIMEMEQDGSPVKIQFRYATKRVVDEHREVVAFSGQSQVLEAFGAVISGVRCREKHWFVLSEISPGVTMVKVCMSRVVNFDCDLPLCQPFVDRTIQMLAKQKQMGFEALLEDVERRLFVGCQ